RRIYVSAYQAPTPAADGGQIPAASHLFRSDDDGMTFTDEPLTGFVYGAAPEVYLKAVDPANENIVYAVSLGSAPPSGDRLYRSSDGGGTFAEVLATTYAISDVVVRDPQHVIVATEFYTSFRSSDGGLTFQPLAG